MAEAGDEDLKAAGVEEIIVAPEGQEEVLGGDDAAAAFAQELENIGLEARDEGPRVSDQSALARREESCSGAAMSGVRRGAGVPRRTEPKRVSAALAERTGFDRFDIDIDTESRQCIYIKP